MNLLFEYFVVQNVQQDRYLSIVYEVFGDIIVIFDFHDFSSLFFLADVVVRAFYDIYLMKMNCIVADWEYQDTMGSQVIPRYFFFVVRYLYNIIDQFEFCN